MTINFKAAAKRAVVLAPLTFGASGCATIFGPLVGPEIGSQELVRDQVCETDVGANGKKTKNCVTMSGIAHTKGRVNVAYVNTKDERDPVTGKLLGVEATSTPSFSQTDAGGVSQITISGFGVVGQLAQGIGILTSAIQSVVSASASASDSSLAASGFGPGGLGVPRNGHMVFQKHANGHGVYTDEKGNSIHTTKDGVWAASADGHYSKFNSQSKRFEPQSVTYAINAGVVQLNQLQIKGDVTNSGLNLGNMNGPGN